MLACLAFVFLFPLPNLGLPQWDGLPPVCLADLDRFPDAKTADRMERLGRAYFDWLELRVQAFPGWEADQLTERIAAARQLHELWSHLDQAHISESFEYILENLRLLREGLGPQAYYQGLMPPPVPLHYFTIH